MTDAARCRVCGGTRGLPNILSGTDATLYGHKLCTDPFHWGGPPVSVGASLVNVACGGCFDLLHVGHVRLLQAARALGHRLVVFMNSDASVGELKGIGRPVIEEDQRAEMLLALRCVDEVVVFGESTPAPILERLYSQSDYRVENLIWVKGSEYAAGGLPMSERAVIEAHGGVVHFMNSLAAVSTSKIVAHVVRCELEKLRGEL